MVENFQFTVGGDIRGEWRPGAIAASEVEAGQSFFLASWVRDSEAVGWFGIYHEALSSIEDRARELAHTKNDWWRGRGWHSTLVELSNHTPGWGFFYSSRSSLRLWRDPFGRLPIFWMRRNGGVEWATRPGAMKNFRPAVRRSRLYRFLSRSGDSKRDDFWEGVLRVRAGEFLDATSSGPIRFSNWWPPVGESIEGGAEVEQRTADLLLKSIQQSVLRGGKLVALSGGVDSSLLTAFMVELGEMPASISMVSPSTEVFDERSTVEILLKDLSIKGHFFDIGGKVGWDRTNIHHPVVDFGPTAYSEAAYFRPFLEQVREILGNENPNILISGVGADQLFSCSPGDFLKDQVALWRWKTAYRERKVKLIAKELAGKWGFNRAPGRGGSQDLPSWMNQMRKKWDLYENRYYDRTAWKNKKSTMFRAWSWEHTVRLMERYRRETGVLLDLPFLTTELAEFVLTIPPILLRTRRYDKLILRRLLQNRVHDNIVWKPKRGVFDEIIWTGLTRYLKPSLDELLDNSMSGELQMMDFDILRKVSVEIHNSPTRVGMHHGHEFWRAIAVQLWLRELRNFCEDGTQEVEFDNTFC